MTKVFLGGSRHASRLNREVIQRLDKIIDNSFPIVIGDANGADKAMQQYLCRRDYRNVEVFCSEGVCRNNIGNWQVRSIPARSRQQDVQFFSAKDRAMAREATVGLMIWDGKSTGTLVNVFRLLSLNKKAVMYIVPERDFRTFQSMTEWEGFLAQRELNLRRKVQERTKQEAPADLFQ